jgi:hypothetical protein
MALGSEPRVPAPGVPGAYLPAPGFAAAAAGLVAALVPTVAASLEEEVDGFLAGAGAVVASPKGAREALCVATCGSRAEGWARLLAAVLWRDPPVGASCCPGPAAVHPRGPARARQPHTGGFGGRERNRIARAC